MRPRISKPSQRYLTLFVGSCIFHFSKASKIGLQKTVPFARKNKLKIISNLFKLVNFYFKMGIIMNKYAIFIIFRKIRGSLHVRFLPRFGLIRLFLSIQKITLIRWIAIVFNNVAVHYCTTMQKLRTHVMQCTKTCADHQENCTLYGFKINYHL